MRSKIIFLMTTWTCESVTVLWSLHTLQTSFADFRKLRLLMQQESQHSYMWQERDLLTRKNKFVWSDWAGGCRPLTTVPLHTRGTHHLVNIGMLAMSCEFFPLNEAVIKWFLQEIG
jgi:hypothetical protein